MAIVTRNKPKDVEEQQTPIVTDIGGDRSPIVDTELTDVKNVLPYVSGRSWIVDYYLQVLGPEQAVTAFDPNVPNALQQYVKVHGFELKVQSALSTQEDQLTGALTLTGDAYVTGVIVPNKGDVFLADTGEGQDALLTVTDTSRLSHFKDTVYSISYRVIYRGDRKVLNMLEQRVVKRLYYRQEQLLNGSNPLLAREEVERVDNLKEMLKKLASYFCSRFYSHEYKTLLVPDDKHLVYDPMVVKTFIQMFDSDEVPLLRELRQLNIQVIDQLRQRTIWDAIIYRDSNIFYEIEPDADCVRIHRFRDQPEFGGVAFSGLDYLIIPRMSFNSGTHHQQTRLSFSSYFNKPVKRYTSLERRYPDKLEDTSKPSEEGLAHKPIVSQLNGYLFPKELYGAFKADVEYLPESELEALVIEHLKQRNVSLEMLTTLSNKAFTWEHTEAFYYIPVLLILIKSALVSGRR